MTPADEQHLRRAIELAALARHNGDEPFGSLLVGPGDETLSEEVNTVVTDEDITAHPELKLARWAAAELDPDVAHETTMYTSCQPCPMCAAVIERSGLGRVVFALSIEQLSELRHGDVDGTGPGVVYDGPALFDEARVPVTAP